MYITVTKATLICPRWYPKFQATPVGYAFDSSPAHGCSRWNIGDTKAEEAGLPLNDSKESKLYQTIYIYTRFSLQHDAHAWIIRPNKYLTDCCSHYLYEVIVRSSKGTNKSPKFKWYTGIPLLYPTTFEYHASKFVEHDIRWPLYKTKTC